MSSFMRIIPPVSFAISEPLPIFGAAIVKGKILGRGTGEAGIVVGAITIYAGIEVAYLGFGYTNIVGLRGISMMIFYLGHNSRWFYVEKINVYNQSEALRNVYILNAFSPPSKVLESSPK